VIDRGGLQPGWHPRLRGQRRLGRLWVINTEPHRQRSAPGGAAAGRGGLQPVVHLMRKRPRRRLPKCNPLRLVGRTAAILWR
jgi:hypothetical protein